MKHMLVAALILFIHSPIHAANNTEVLRECRKNLPPTNYKKYTYRFQKCQRDGKIAYETVPIPKTGLNGFTIKNSNKSHR